jgi:UDP-N-acetylmuramate dehydrogenase
MNKDANISEADLSAIAARFVANEPLAHHTSLRIGGAARFFFEARSVEDLRIALHWSKLHSVPVVLLGGGTNVLVCDEGFDGLVITYQARNWNIKDSSAKGATGTEGVLYGEAGVPIGRLAWSVGGQGWSGLEWAAGLPGSLGGAIYGNAGCYGGDIAGILCRGWVLVGDTVEEWMLEQFDFGYRTSRLKQQTANNSPDAPDRPAVVLAAELQLVRGDTVLLMETMKNIATRRKEATPAGSSCGSVFKNPPDAPPAGQLIDQAGVKGTRIGGAEISSHHANYIVNLGDASSSDVLRLIALARDSVFNYAGVTLELEIQIVGNCDAEGTG